MPFWTEGPGRPRKTGRGGKRKVFPVIPGAVCLIPIVPGIGEEGEEGLAPKTGQVVVLELQIMQARMAKLVDAPDLGSGGAIRAGSSPVPGIF